MDLKKYLKQEKIKYTVWSKKNNISPSILYRYLKQNKKISASVALRIQKSTKGAVSLKDLIK